MVNATTTVLHDASRPHLTEKGAPRPVRTTIWRAGAARPAPLILLSHGTGGAAATLSWLAEAMAARGCTVAAVDHHGNTSVEPYVALGFARVWERPRDFTVVLDALAGDPDIDLTRVGAAGFSLGGYTVAALLGARVSPRRLAMLLDSPGLAPLPEYPGLVDELRATLPPAELAALIDESSTDVGDDRVRRALQIAPLGALTDEASIAAIDRPLRTLWCGADELTPAEGNAEVYLRAPAATGRCVSDTAGHFDVLTDERLQAALVDEAEAFFRNLLS
jgi:predicted dienelactone hydrolase